MTTHRNTIRHSLAGLLLAAVLPAAQAWEPNPENFFAARDRVEWDIGGLYEGRFSDGTPFQLQLVYRKPDQLPADVAEALDNRYWYPRHFTGKVLVLKADARQAGRVALSLMPGPHVQGQESFSGTISSDKLEGKGNWTSGTKRLSFSLKRIALYRAVAVSRPSPEAKAEGSERPFLFTAVYPVVGERAVDDWIHSRVASCGADLECFNKVEIRWQSKGLLSLDASSWDYNLGAAHGNYSSTMRHYAVDAGGWRQVGLSSFLDAGAACRTRVSSAIQAKLRADELSWPEHGALNDKRDPKFIATPKGIEFHWDPYEVGSYAQGAPSVFLTRPELGGCVKALPEAG